MAPFGPAPAMVGNETSFNAPVSRRNVSSASTASISVSAPEGASRSIQARQRVSAADVEGPGHGVRIRQHQRIDAELADLGMNTPQLVRFGFARILRAVNGHW